MPRKIKVGVLRETKNPPDKRVAITPKHAVELLKRFPNVELIVQPSDYRCFKDSEYLDLGITMSDYIEDCDVLIGVKEVKIPTLIANKTYIYFSHTAKKQHHNQKLLQEMLQLNITMLDYEYFTDQNNMRLVAFGRWAGIVGAFNGLRGYGKRFNLFDLKPAHQCHDMIEMLDELKKVELPPIKILITGNGRVANGALETLAPLNLEMVSPDDFLNKVYSKPVICQITPEHYVELKQGGWISLDHFFKNPSDYKSKFLPFTKVTDLLIPCHFWDEKSPVFITLEDMRANDFKISMIADVSCDIDGPIPSTIKPSTIADPFYGYDPKTGKEVEPFSLNAITVMAVDNLPGELPRDASSEFGNALLDKVLPSLFGDDSTGIIERATITKDGKLTPKYAYLQNFADGKE